MNIVTLEEMYEYAESQGIHVDCYDMNHIPCLSVYSDEEYFIGINPFALTSYADELIDLTHEIGHCVTGAFYDSNSPQYWRIRCERIAEKWAIEKLVPKDKLIQAYKDGICDNSELADLFGVTEDFLQSALKYYCDHP